MIHHYHFKEISSTNDTIKELLEEHDKVIVTADVQVSGRGRNNRNWLGNVGDNVYLSYGTRQCSTMNSTELSLNQAVGCISAYEALVKVCGVDIFKLKYPNDIMVNTEDGYRKICGVLVENSFSGSTCQSSVIGIGINVNQLTFPAEIENKATSLKMLGFDVATKDLIKALQESIQIWIYKRSEEVFFEWYRRLNIIGRDINIAGRNGLWEAIFLMEDGRLKVRSRSDNETMIISDLDSITYQYD
jgi:BirA family biotin operon repressor/biotin-[acetyl-CoA-carboxylase] ligase